MRQGGAHHSLCFVLRMYSSVKCKSVGTSSNIFTMPRSMRPLKNINRPLNVLLKADSIPRNLTLATVPDSFKFSKLGSCAMTSRICNTGTVDVPTAKEGTQCDKLPSEGIQENDFKPASLFRGMRVTPLRLLLDLINIVCGVRRSCSRRVE